MPVKVTARKEHTCLDVDDECIQIFPGLHSFFFHLECVRPDILIPTEEEILPEIKIDKEPKIVKPTRVKFSEGTLEWPRQVKIGEKLLQEHGLRDKELEKYK